MDHIAIEAVQDLVGAVLRQEIQHEDMTKEMDDAAQRLHDIGISDYFAAFIMGVADQIATGLQVELEQM